MGIIGKFLSILFRLFLIVAGGGLTYAAYHGIELIIKNGQFQWEEILTMGICGGCMCLGVCGVIIGIWYRKIMDKSYEQEAAKERKRKIKERERSREERLRRDRRGEIAGVLLAFGLAAVVLYFFYPKNEDEIDSGQIAFGIGLVGYFIYLGYSPLKHLIATRKDWKTASADDFEMKTLQKIERLKSWHLSDDILITATEDGDIRDALEDYVEYDVTNYVNGAAQLWQLEKKRYAITFPCGVNRLQLMQMMCELCNQCSDIRLWMPSRVTKRTTGQWTLAIFDDEGYLVAASDDGRQWRVADDDYYDLLFIPSNSYHLTFQPRPNIDFSSAQKKALYYQNEIYIKIENIEE